MQAPLSSGGGGQAPLSLAAALRWGAARGAAAPDARERVLVGARCERVTKMSVDEERTRFVAEACLSGDGAEHVLPICELLVRPARPLAPLQPPNLHPHQDPYGPRVDRASVGCAAGGDLVPNPNQNQNQVASMFGCSAQLFYEQLGSEDKALKRAAKAKAKEINARFTDLDGCFELGYGQLGLTVYRIPER